jgi:RNA polymerase sigma-70 factor (ECF subfamily)
MRQASAAEIEDSDELLADRARAGDREAFEHLVERYQGRVYRLAMRLSCNPNDAEEITQEAFLRAHRGIAQFRGQSRFGTWVYRIAVNEALMRKRAAKCRPVQALESLLPHFPDAGRFAAADAEPALLADDLLDRKQVAERVRQALSRLDEAHRTVLVLRDLEELPADEVAELVGVSPEVVRQRAHRARLQMREELAPLLRGRSAERFR